MAWVARQAAEAEATGEARAAARRTAAAWAVVAALAAVAARTGAVAPAAEPRPRSSDSRRRRAVGSRAPRVRSYSTRRPPRNTPHTPLLHRTRPSSSRGDQAAETVGVEPAAAAAAACCSKSRSRPSHHRTRTRALRASPPPRRPSQPASHSRTRRAGQAAAAAAAVPEKAPRARSNGSRRTARTPTPDNRRRPHPGGSTLAPRRRSRGKAPPRRTRSSSRAGRGAEAEVQAAGAWSSRSGSTRSRRPGCSLQPQACRPGMQTAWSIRSRKNRAGAAAAAGWAEAAAGGKAPRPCSSDSRRTVPGPGIPVQGSRCGSTRAPHHRSPRTGRPYRRIRPSNRAEAMTPKGHHGVRSGRAGCCRRPPQRTKEHTAPRTAFAEAAPTRMSISSDAVGYSGGAGWGDRGAPGSMAAPLT